MNIGAILIQGSIAQTPLGQIGGECQRRVGHHTNSNRLCIGYPVSGIRYFGSKSQTAATHQSPCRQGALGSRIAASADGIGLDRRTIRPRRSIDRQLHTGFILYINPPGRGNIPVNPRRCYTGQGWFHRSRDGQREVYRFTAYRGVPVISGTGQRPHTGYRIGDLVCQGQRRRPGHTGSCCLSRNRPFCRTKGIGQCVRKRGGCPADGDRPGTSHGCLRHGNRGCSWYGIQSHPGTAADGIIIRSRQSGPDLE